MPQWMPIASRKVNAATRFFTSPGHCHLPTQTLALRRDHRLNHRLRWRSHARLQINAHGEINSRSWRRHVSLSSIPTVLVPPTVFVGLLVTLWTYKCLIMILFQNKIIYMPSIPPFSRSEKISDYVAADSPVVWEEKRIHSLDGTSIALCVGSIPSRRESRSSSRNVTVLYFQGLV